MENKIQKNAFQLFIFLIVITMSVEIVILLRQNRKLISILDLQRLQSNRIEPESMRVGDDAIPFTLKDLSGENVSLRKHKGKRILLLFFSTKCPTCEKRISLWNKIYKHRNESNVEVIGICPDEDLRIKHYAKYNGLKFTILVDPMAKVTRMYNVYLVPQEILLDEKGKVKYVWTRRSYSREEEIEKIKEYFNLKEEDIPL